MQLTKIGKMEERIWAVFLALLLFSPLAYPENRTKPLSANYADSPLSAGMDIQYSSVRYSQYQLDANMGVPRESNMFKVGVEWLSVISKYGKMGTGFSVGFGYAPNLPLEDGRFASLRTFPLDLMLSLRGDFVKDQIVIPFIKSGIGVTFAQQDSVSGASKPASRFWGWNYGAGMEFCLNRLDRQSANSLDASIGINSTFLIFDYSRSLPLGTYEGGNLSHEGFSLGLRFEM